jgi:hypothetical protein
MPSTKMRPVNSGCFVKRCFPIDSAALFQSVLGDLFPHVAAPCGSFLMSMAKTVVFGVVACLVWVGFGLFVWV